MARRPDRRRAPALERLEGRAATSAVPSAPATYLLYLTNLTRQAPDQAIAKITRHLDDSTLQAIAEDGLDLAQVKGQIASGPRRQPLAWNGSLAAAAEAHSGEMAAHNFQSHSSLDGSSPADRLNRAGYTDRGKAGENVYAAARSVDHAMQAFLIDWKNPLLGHRKNLQEFDSAPDDSFNEMGAGLVAKPNAFGDDTLVVTQELGRRPAAAPQVVGVAFDDNDGDGLYSLGEGRGGVQVSVTDRDSGQSVGQVNTWDAGAYQIPLRAGRFRVQAAVGDQVVRTQDIDVDRQNVEVDFNLNRPWDGAPAATPIVPAPAPETAPGGAGVVADPEPIASPPVVEPPSAPPSQPAPTPVVEAQAVLTPPVVESISPTVVLPTPTAELAPVVVQAQVEEVRAPASAEPVPVEVASVEQPMPEVTMAPVADGASPARETSDAPLSEVAQFDQSGMDWDVWEDIPTNEDLLGS